MTARNVAAMHAHTDIVAEGWVARLPAAWRPYVLLARLDRPIGAWLLFIPGTWGILLAQASPGETVRLLALFGIGSVVMRSAGCVVNDLWDRDIDRLVARTARRPLASGALRARHALVFLVLLLAIGFAVLVQLNRVAIALGVGSLLLVALYPLAKRVTWWPQLVMGFTFGAGAPVGYAAGTGRIDLSFTLIYAAAVFWDLGFDTIYAHQDREDDALIGVRSTARLFGRLSNVFVAACYLVCVELLVLAGLHAGLRPWVFVPALIPGAWLLARQAWRLDIHDPAGCLRLFRANRLAGLAIAAALLLGRM